MRKTELQTIQRRNSILKVFLKALFVLIEQRISRYIRTSHKDCYRMCVTVDTAKEVLGPVPFILTALRVYADKPHVSRIRANNHKSSLSSLAIIITKSHAKSFTNLNTLIH